MRVCIDVCIIICVQRYMYVCACAGIVLVCACACIIVCRCVLSVHSSYTCSEVESIAIYPQVGEPRKAVQSLCWDPGEKVVIEHQNLQLRVG